MRDAVGIVNGGHNSLDVFVHDLFDQIEHSFDVGRVVAQHQKLVGIDRQDAGGVFAEGGEDLGDFGRFGVRQLHGVSDKLFGVRKLAFFKQGDVGAFREHH